MQPEKEKKNKAPSPFLLLGLVLALGFVVFDFATKKQPTEPPRMPEELTRAPRVVLPLLAGEKKEEKKDLVTVQPSRDPFLPPLMVRRKMEAAVKKTAVSNAKEKMLAASPTGGEEFSQEEPKVAIQPVWTGSLATAEGQVVIIQCKNKTYILHLGQNLPGTDYQLTEIQQEMVILKAPGKELRLRRKEEAK